MFRAKKQPTQRSASAYSSRMSPTHSLTFVSRDASKLDTEEMETGQLKQETRPLSTSYCERMEITLSEVAYKNNSPQQSQHYDPQQASSQRKRYSRFSKQHNEVESSSDDSDQNLHFADAPNGHWAEQEGRPTDNIELRYSHEGYATDISSNVSEKHLQHIPRENAV